MGEIERKKEPKMPWAEHGRRISELKGLDNMDFEPTRLHLPAWD